jgi:hypothetical protein
MGDRAKCGKIAGYEADTKHKRNRIKKWVALSRRGDPPLVRGDRGK